MSKRWEYIVSPLDSLAITRESLSETLRKGRRGRYKLDAGDRHWLGIWIKEYDKAITLLQEGTKQ